MNSRSHKQAAAQKRSPPEEILNWLPDSERDIPDEDLPDEGDETERNEE